jgi:hypothetical protein
VRKFLWTVAAASLAAGLLAATASATFDPQFNVIEKQVSYHNVSGHGFSFKGKLFNPQNRADRVGRDWVRCKFNRHHRLKCRALAHLNGEIGGFGNIRVSGGVGRHDNRLNVVGGTHDFDGVAGKVLVRSLHEQHASWLHFALTR